MTTEALVSACLLCGPRAEPRSQLDGLLSECASCGFVWTADSTPAPHELYGEDHHHHGSGYPDHFLAGPRAFEARRRLRWLLSVVRPVSLVEAGSAGGFFVAAARAAGIDAVGVEVSEAASLFARERLGVPVRQGCFEEWVPERLVDVVCAFHVLEHVADPRVFLRAVRGALVPGGWLALEVPNIASAAARRLGPDWPGLQPRHHRWHFTRDSLVRLLTGNGFRVIRLDTVVFRYYMPAWYRLRHVHRLLPDDWRNLGTPWLTHPHRGDLLRVVARLPRSRGGPR